MVNPGIYLKKKLAKLENSLEPFHHTHNPIAYPIAAPKIEKMLHKAAKYNAFCLLLIQSGINNTSGGIGKNDASAKEIPHRALGPVGFSASDKTQSYSFLIKFIPLIIIEYSN